MESDTVTLKNALEAFGKCSLLGIQKDCQIAELQREVSCLRLQATHSAMRIQAMQDEIAEVKSRAATERIVRPDDDTDLLDAIEVIPPMEPEIIRPFQGKGNPPLFISKDTR